MPMWLVHLVVASLALHGLVDGGQSRAPVVQSVDLLVPHPPVTFTQGGRTQLAYELHITNFQSVDVSLSVVRVVSASGDGTLAEYQDQDLRQRLVRPGLPHNHQSPEILGAGMRAVMMLWIDLPPGERPPSSIAHRIELKLMRSAEPVSAVVSGGAAVVATQSTLVLDPPLRGGPWVAVYDPLLKGGHRTAIYTIGGRARIPARFAIDWIAMPRDGALSPNAAARPADWNGFGSDVLAVADGVISAARDDVPDFTPPPIAAEDASGNYIAIDLGGDLFAFYEHLQRGSVAVRTGERVARGQVLAKLGASGSSSIGPHLHFHVSDANSTLQAEGLPFAFARFDHLGAFASIDALVGGKPWVPVAGNAGGPRLAERPAANAVIRFP